MENQNTNSNLNPAQNVDPKKDRINQAIHRKRIKQLSWIVGVIVVIGLLIGGIVWYSIRDAKNLPGVFYPEQGREHIAPDHQHTYNSNPPTSGWHYPTPASWGVYHEELPDEEVVHNLEHGGVWISYKPGIPDDVIKRLEGFFDTYGTKVIVTPRSKNDTDIALVVWTRLDKFNVSEFSEARVDNFIRRLRNRTGPEPLAP